MDKQYQASRERIKKRLYDINTTALDKDTAYEQTVDYVLNVAEKCWRAAASSYGWELDDIEFQIKIDLLQHGIIPQQTEPGTDTGKK